MFVCVCFAASTCHCCPWTSGRTTRTTSTLSMTSTGCCTHAWRASRAASPSWTASARSWCPAPKSTRSVLNNLLFCTSVFGYSCVRFDLGLWIYTALCSKRFTFIASHTRIYTRSHPPPALSEMHGDTPREHSLKAQLWYQIDATQRLQHSREPVLRRVLVSRPITDLAAASP